MLLHTAASLWSVTLPPRSAGTLAITYRGFLLPQPSTLPYPPFALGRVYDTMEAGNGRLFSNGPGTWLSLVVDRAGRPTSGIREGALRLTLSGATPNVTTITNIHVLPSTPGWGGRIERSALMAAPYAVTVLASAEDSSAVESPELVGNILVASDLHPYRLPTDPVTGSVTEMPTPERCRGGEKDRRSDRRLPFGLRPFPIPARFR